MYLILACTEPYCMHATDDFYIVGIKTRPTLQDPDAPAIDASDHDVNPLA
jgi:hypothetical protein